MDGAGMDGDMVECDRTGGKVEVTKDNRLRHNFDNHTIIACIISMTLHFILHDEKKLPHSAGITISSSNPVVINSGMVSEGLLHISLHLPSS